VTAPKRKCFGWQGDESTDAAKPFAGVQLTTCIVSPPKELTVKPLLALSAEARERVDFDAIDGRNLAGEKERLCLTYRFDISRQNACANNQD